MYDPKHHHRKSILLVPLLVSLNQWSQNKLSDEAKIKVWQRNYYEHILRNELDLYFTRRYIQNNPVKWELDENYKR